MPYFWTATWGTWYGWICFPYEQHGYFKPLFITLCLKLFHYLIVLSPKSRHFLGSVFTVHSFSRYIFTDLLPSHYFKYLPIEWFPNYLNTEAICVTACCLLHKTNLKLPQTPSEIRIHSFLFQIFILLCREFEMHHYPVLCLDLKLQTSLTSSPLCLIVSHHICIDYVPITYLSVGKRSKVLDEVLFPLHSQLY